MEDGLDPNSMMGRAVAGPAESIYTANQISIVRPVDSDDEDGDEETYLETFSPLTAAGEEAACLLGTSQPSHFDDAEQGPCGESFKKTNPNPDF